MEAEDHHAIRILSSIIAGKEAWEGADTKETGDSASGPWNLTHSVILTRFKWCHRTESES